MNSQNSNNRDESSLSKNPVEFVVLGFLESGPTHGYQIYNRMRYDIGAVWRIGKSQLYALLATLERKGFLIHDRVGQENLPAKNIFSITEKGISVFEQWRDSPVIHIRQLRLEFLTKLFFAQIKGADLERELLRRQLEFCQEKEHVLGNCRSSCSSKIERQALDYRLEIVEASTRWLSKILRDL